MIDVKIGNSFDLIKELNDNSIDCVVTSPPYWSLRDYGTQPIIFDEDKNCSHDFEMNNFKYEHKRKAEIIKVGNSLKSEVHSKDYSEGFCKKCGAWKGQLGLEPSSELFIKHLSDLFLDVKSKLKDTGSCWVNLGDTYSTSNKNNENANISDKSLCLIPDRFAMKMIDNGWILENKIIWKKPNSMPESVKDRLSKSYEMFYHFVKTSNYYIDNKQFKLDSRYNGNELTNIWHINTKGYREAHFAVFNKELISNPILMTCPQNGLVLDPFGGSGTTGEFCNENNRNAILFELNPDYKKLIDERVQINYDLNSFF